MAKSEKAKALEAEQKAAVRAEKLRKKNSDNPADWGQLRQYQHLYKSTAEVDPKLNLLLAGGVLVGVALAVILGLATSVHWAITVLFALSLAVASLPLVLIWRAKKGAFTRYKGQPGSAEVALSMLNKKKYTYSTAVAFNREMDMVHRVVGPSGVVLIAEGTQPARVRALLSAEARRHERVLFGIPVTSLVMGDGQGQTQLSELQKAIEKLPKAIQPAQQAAIQLKLRTLDSSRPKAPLPKGPLPNVKGANRAMRGR